MNKSAMLKEYEQIHAEFLGQFENIIITFYRTYVNKELLLPGIEKWKIVHNVNKFMNFSIGDTPTECLENFLAHTRYMQADDVVEREFYSCVDTGDSDLYDIDEQLVYFKCRDQIWKNFISKVTKLANNTH